MSEDQEQMKPDRDKLSEADDVEAHRLAERLSELDEKRDKIGAADDADVEGHMLGEKHSAGKHQP